MKIMLGDTQWKIKIKSPEQFIKEGEHDTGAITDLAHHTITFRSDELLAEHVRHELFHAYFAMALVHSANLNQEALEEVSASVVGKYGEDLIKNSKRVISFLKRKKKP